MKGHVKIRGNFHHILVVLPAAIIMLFACLVMLPVVSESSYAEGDEPEEGISITISNPVSANLVLFDEGDYKIAKDTVSVSSSAPYGYELYLSTDSEEHQSIYLNNDPTSSSVISPVAGTIAEPAVLTSNTWGFAIAGQGNFDNEYSTTSPDPNSRFAIIPTANNQAVYENRSADADDDIDFYYGIKIEPTLEPGEYTTSALYTAIAKIPPLTAKAVLGNNGNLNFLYDRNTYAVGETYTDNLSENTIIVAAYNDFAINASSRPWTQQKDSITTANFDSSFIEVKPTSTAHWFRDLNGLKDITNIQNFNTSQTTNMNSMFDHAGSYTNTFNFDLRNLNTSSVQEMDSMFAGSGRVASNWNLNLTGWKVDKVINMNNMFFDAGMNAENWSLEGLDGWDTTNVMYASAMFKYAGYLADSFSPDLSGWNLSNLVSAPYMFERAGYNAKKFSPNLSNWIIGNKNSTTQVFLQRMFGEAGYNANTFSIDLSGWSTAQIQITKEMFQKAGYNSTSWSIGDISNWDVSTVVDMSYMFYNAGYKADEWGYYGLLRSKWHPPVWYIHTNFINLNEKETNQRSVDDQPL